MYSRIMNKEVKLKLKEIFLNKKDKQNNKNKNKKRNKKIQIRVILSLTRKTLLLLESLKGKIQWQEIN